MRCSFFAAFAGVTSMCSFRNASGYLSDFIFVCGDFLIFRCEWDPLGILPWKKNLWFFYCLVLYLCMYEK